MIVQVWIIHDHVIVTLCAGIVTGTLLHPLNVYPVTSATVGVVIDVL